MNDEELCKWLRANSSGDCRKSSDAADRIEGLIRERDELHKALEDIRGHIENVTPTGYKFSGAWNIAVNARPRLMRY